MYLLFFCALYMEPLIVEACRDLRVRAGRVRHSCTHVNLFGTPDEGVIKKCSLGRQLILNLLNELKSSHTIPADLTQRDRQSNSHSHIWDI